jgi:hypothetical protein
MRFLSIGSRFALHASFPRSVTLTQLRFTLLTVTSSQRDLHPKVCAHAGRTTVKKAALQRPFLWPAQWHARRQGFVQFARLA